jgi:hypothetical protein
LLSQIGLKTDDGGQMHSNVVQQAEHEVDKLGKEDLSFPNLSRKVESVLALEYRVCQEEYDGVIKGRRQ